MPKLSFTVLVGNSSSHLSWFNHVAKCGINLGSSACEHKLLYFSINISGFISLAFRNQNFKPSLFDPRLIELFPYIIINRYRFRIRRFARLLLGTCLSSFFPINLPNFNNINLIFSPFLLY